LVESLFSKLLVHGVESIGWRLWDDASRGVCPIYRHSFVHCNINLCDAATRPRD
jgi:hypothetical protein